MKKILTLFITCIAVISTNVKAQDVVVIYPVAVVGVNPEVNVVVTAQKEPLDTRTKFYVGLKGGYNYTNVYDTQGENFKADPKIGFAAGVFLTIPIGRFLGVQPEVLFSQKGFHASGMLLGSPYELTRTTNFVDVPLLISLKPGRMVTLMIGPQFSYLLKQRDKFNGEPLNADQEQEFKNDNIRKNILCFLGGIDFNFNHFVLGTRVGWDIQNNNGDGTSSTPRYKNVWVQATLGIRL